MFDSIENIPNNSESFSQSVWPADRASLHDFEDNFDFDLPTNEKSAEREKKKRKPKFRPIY